MRNGNFSSSEIHKLIKAGPGKLDVFSSLGLTYIKEKKYEQLLKRALSTDTNSRPTSWGTFMELYVWNYKMGLSDYKFEHKTRYSHDSISNWNGCPDLVGDDRVGDIKCPYTLKSFCEMMECFDNPILLREIKPEYYWQLVSNAILTNKSKAELIVYVPFKSEIADIKTFSEETDVFFQNNLDQNKYAWINFAQDNDLPYLREDGFYSNLNTLAFDIPLEDKELLTERVKLAVNLLIN